MPILKAPSKDVLTKKNANKGLRPFVNLKMMSDTCCHSCGS